MGMLYHCRVHGIKSFDKGLELTVLVAGRGQYHDEIGAVIGHHNAGVVLDPIGRRRVPAGLAVRRILPLHGVVNWRIEGMGVDASTPAGVFVRILEEIPVISDPKLSEVPCGEIWVAS